MNHAIIIAGGTGTRMKLHVPKQFVSVEKKPVIVYTMEAFQNHPEIDTITIVCIKGWEEVIEAYSREYRITKLKHIVLGGDCGQASIRNGVYELEKHYSGDDIVLIHDAIRPLVSAEIISDCLVKAREFGDAITVIPCAEAMLETDDGAVSIGSYDRNRLKRTQTPQGFKLSKICDLHRRALEKGITNSVASCTLMIEMGEQVHFSMGSEKNIKLTTQDDLEIFRALLHAGNREWLQ